MAARTDLEQLVYQMSADVTLLTKQNAKALSIVKKGASDSQEHLDRHPLQWAKFFGNPGESVKKVFDSSRLATLEAGGERLRIFGSALEPLGAAGIVAAAGIAAVGIAFEGARKSMEWTEQLEKTAGVIGVTTTELQEYHHVAQQFGIDNATMDEALKGLGESLGKMQSGVRAQRTIPFFSELKIDRSELANIQDGAQLIPIIADHMKNLDSEAKKLQLAKALGGEGILPVLEATAGRIGELRNEAHSLGLVMDEDLIKKGAAANKQFAEASDVIKTQMMVAFVELAPTIAQVAGLLERAALGAANFAKAFGHGPDALRQRIEVAKGHIAEMQRGGPLALLAAAGAGHPFDVKGAIADEQSQIAAGSNLADALEMFKSLTTPPDAPKPKVKLGAIKGPKGRAAPQDKTDDLNNTAEQALDDATKAAAEATGRLATSIDGRAQAEEDALSADTAAKGLKLDKDLLAIKNAAVDTNRTVQAMLIEEARRQEQIAAAVQSELIERNRVVEQIQEGIASTQLDAGFRSSALESQGAYAQAMAAIAKTGAERESWERKVLAASQEREKVQAQADVDTAIQGYAEASTKGDASAMLKAVGAVVQATDRRDALGPLQQAQRQDLADRQLSPWDAWLAEGKRASADVGNALQTEAVTGMNSFNDGIASAISNGKNMGQVFHSVFTTMEGDAIKFALRLAESAIFSGGGKIPGFAGGTDSAPGGLALVGENGPELVNLPRGSGVTTNKALRAATSSPSMSSRAASTSNTFRITVDVSGANGNAEIARIAHQAAAQGAAQAVDVARRSQGSWGMSDFLLSR